MRWGSLAGKWKWIMARTLGWSREWGRLGGWGAAHSDIELAEAASQFFRWGFGGPVRKRRAGAAQSGADPGSSPILPPLCRRRRGPARSGAATASPRRQCRRPKTPVSFYAWKPTQEIFNPLRVNIFPAAYDDLLPAAYDVVVPVYVPARDVTGVEPASGQNFLRCRFALIVAAHHVRSLKKQFARRLRGRFITCVIHNPGLPTGGRQPYRAASFDVLHTQIQHAWAARLRQAIADAQRNLWEVLPELLTTLGGMGWAPVWIRRREHSASATSLMRPASSATRIS